MTRLLPAVALLVALATGGLTPPARQAVAADAPKAAAADFFFKPGDRIVFLGDSITKP